MAQEQKHEDGQLAGIIGKIRSDLNEGLKMIGGADPIGKGNLRLITEKANEIRAKIKQLTGSESEQAAMLFAQLSLEDFEKLIEFMALPEFSWFVQK